MLGRTKQYTYIVDKLNGPGAELLNKAMKAVSGVEKVQIKVNSGIVVVTAKKDVEQEMIMACGLAGLVFRTKVDPKKAAYYR